MSSALGPASLATSGLRSLRLAGLCACGIRQELSDAALPVPMRPRLYGAFWPGLSKGPAPLRDISKCRARSFTRVLPIPNVGNCRPYRAGRFEPARPEHRSIPCAPLTPSGAAASPKATPYRGWNPRRRRLRFAIVPFGVNGWLAALVRAYGLRLGLPRLAGLDRARTRQRGRIRSRRSRSFDLCFSLTIALR